METFCEKKIREKLTGEKLQGRGCNNPLPLGCIRVNTGENGQSRYRGIQLCSVCSGSIVVTAYDVESGRPGSNPEWGLIYYTASITAAQGLPDPSSLRGSTLRTRAAEHEGYNWGMQVSCWLQPCAVFGHSCSGISWHMPHK